ncbi:TonB-dependent receptor [Sphingobium nicotianae]|uniref:TonB-dependent receptor n=1 Tax=Sphingobium nicotianae TaxID=2782607 RepID=A0A9X1DFY3_9SPHN|nr:TonB-dependent receptor [Sphingobium nicotianae]MBT2188793.1 TonB-dependent receptor [Sphingobium nicotianae]
MNKLNRLTMVTMAAPAALCAASAWAQENTASGSGIEDIVVTATRQATNLQDTPVAITAVTSEALEERGLTNIGDLTSVVPNAQFRKTQGAFGPGVSASIRGVGQADTSLAVEPAVAFYLDDVYYPLLLGSNFDLLEIDRIEVLRGPQGTLFGRNSLAGAVNIVSRQPSTAETSGQVQVTIGNYDRRELRAGINLPLGQNVAVSLSALSKKRTGYQRMLDFTCEMKRRGTPALAGSLPYSNLLNVKSTDDCTIGHMGGEDVQAYRGSLLWKASDDLTITLSADYIRDQSENAADTIVSILGNVATPNTISAANYFGIAYDSRFVTGSPYTTYATYNDPIGAGTVIPGNTYYNGFKVNGTSVRGGSRFEPFTDLTNWGVSGKVSWDITPDINLLTVVSHRELDSTQTYDDDGSPLNLVQRLGTNTESYWTVEARLSGKSELIDWVVGAFYFKADGRQKGLFISPASAFQRTINSTFDPTSKAVFANGTIRPFGEKLGFTGGLRYSDDKKVVNFVNLVDTTPNPASDTVFFIVPSQKRIDWKAGINYQATRDILLYASAASGNSLPSFNSRPLQKTQIYQLDGNEDIAYELGAKLDLFDRRVRLNVAAFYTDFKNRPTTISGSEALLDSAGNPLAGNRTLVPLPGGPPGSTTCGAVLPTNTGIQCTGRTYPRNQPATVRGFEAEYTIAPVDGLLINGSVGWSKLEAADIDARAVNKRQNNPFWTANGGIQYTIPVGQIDGTITPRLDWTYESSQVVGGTSTVFNSLMPARSVFNSRISYENSKYDFSVALGVTNLFNKVYYYNVFDSQALGAAYTEAQPAPPRQWYLTVAKKF